MKNTTGFTHWVIVILISVMAVGLVGAAWYYEENREEKTINTNAPTNINLNANLAQKQPLDVCETSSYMKVNSENMPFTIGDYFERDTVSSMGITNDNFSIATERVEGGLFELVRFDPDKLTEVGLHSGDEFDLLLLSSDYKVSACTDNNFKENSKLIIETYSNELISGCYSGKLDCDGTIVEFQALFSGPEPEPTWLTTD